MELRARINEGGEIVRRMLLIPVVVALLVSLNAGPAFAYDACGVMASSCVGGNDEVCSIAQKFGCSYIEFTEEEAGTI